MQRLFIVYNPNSSRFSDVKKDVLDKLKGLKGYIIGKYEVEKTDVDKNAEKFSKILKNGDFVISAGGDATGIIASNAVLKSGKDVSLAVLPYGNFNDLSHTLGIKTFDEIFKNNTIKYYPLEIYVDNKFFRYATCYVTIGIMAESVKIFDEIKMRKILKTAIGRKIGSYTGLMKWYFENRKKKKFMPEFKLNGVLKHPKTSDYVALNGRFMARVMKGVEDYKDPHVFHSMTGRLASFPRLFGLMLRSILSQIPSNKTTGDVIEFLTPGDIEIQTEGEYKKFENVKKIEVRKGKKCLKAVMA